MTVSAAGLRQWIVLQVQGTHARASAQRLSQLVEPGKIEVAAWERQMRQASERS